MLYLLNYGTGMNGKATFRFLGFSLVELVIVVVIIGVIAAIAVMRLGRAAACAEAAALRANLNSLRSVIDQYYAQHDGLYPGTNSDSKQFWKELTKKTNVSGATTGPGRDWGPYLSSKVCPGVGPSADRHEILFSATSPPTVVEMPPNYGWVYNNQTGEIRANTDDLDQNGVGYDTY